MLGDGSVSAGRKDASSFSPKTDVSAPEEDRGKDIIIDGDESGSNMEPPT